MYVNEKIVYGGVTMRICAHAHSGIYTFNYIYYNKIF